MNITVQPVCSHEADAVYSRSTKELIVQDLVLNPRKLCKLTGRHSKSKSGVMGLTMSGLFASSPKIMSCIHWRSKIHTNRSRFRVIPWAESLWCGLKPGLAQLSGSTQGSAVTLLLKVTSDKDLLLLQDSEFLPLNSQLRLIRRRHTQKYLALREMAN
ncbi:hypothetical protein RRG08_061024 [Elysia crispata]|uniref:Uncharacterized protein n=1 Tax=Elysia crispata TaxID=231223 RepID=A0AAE1E5J9_9GAST|nr:hypothetical protein RRG08_061024 [Elysia crispata]